MSVLQLQLIVAFAGILNGIIIAFFLLFARSGNIKANRILSFMLIAAMVKISYAFTVSGFEVSWKTGYWFHLAAMSGYYGIAPLMWLYFKALTDKDPRFNPFDLIHLSPSVYILLVPYFNLSDFIFSLWIAQAQIFAYIILSFVRIRKLVKDDNLKSRRSEFTTMRNILIGITVFWIDVFFLIFNDFAIFYLLELCMLFTIIVYVLVFSAIKQIWIKRANENIKELPYQKGLLEDPEATLLLNKLRELMNSERPFENPDITLPKLAKLLCTTPHKLSEVINRKTGQNFAEFINEYRVEKAKVLLTNPEYSKYKIASIAFDCGFNTLSTFNLAFKKATQVTPSKFRDEMILQNI
jgi:AraC-like DNA-binding protein